MPLSAQMRHAGDQRVPDFPTDFIERTALWRREIVRARIMLADGALSPAKCAELWQVVDCWEWCLRLVVEDFPQELERIDREIEAALRR
jgi:hypothetical protein